MKEMIKTPEGTLRLLFGFFTAVCFAAAVLMPDRAEALAGVERICMQSAQTVKSYFDPSYGGLAGAFVNVGLVCLVMTAFYFLPGSRPDGTSALAFFLTAGLSFWGITILNIWFSFAGVALYCIIQKKSIGSMADALLFSTGLAPIITEMLFRYPADQWHGWTVGGVLLALLVGIFIGFFFPVIVTHAPKMHKGFNLFNAAVSIGLISFFLRALLYKVFLPAPPVAVDVGLEGSFRAVSNLFCLVIFFAAAVWGLLLGGGKQYRLLLRDSGYNVDFFARYGTGASMLNFGVYGLIILCYYNLIGAVWNAATLGVVLCMVCCFAKGSHPLNALPIVLGYLAASFLAKLVCGLIGTDFTLAINTQAIVIGVCFATGLAPIAGEYGFFAGVIGGMVHYTLVSCVPLLHESFCMYNGGFTAAFTCFMLVPVLEHFGKTRDERIKQ